MRKEKDKIVGKITIETERTEYEANYKVYVMVKDKELPIGDFDFEKYNYAYEIIEEIDILEIKETEKLSRELELIHKALLKVCPQEKWNKFLFIVYSKEPKEEIEYKITDWLEKEGFKVSVEVVSIPKITRKSIPITESMFKSMLEKAKEKGLKNE